MDPSTTGEQDEWGHRPTRSSVAQPPPQVPEPPPQARPAPAPIPRFAAVALPEPILPSAPAPGHPPTPYGNGATTGSAPAFGAVSPGIATVPGDGHVDPGAARYGYGAAPPPARTTAPRPTIERVLVAGATPMWRALVLGGLALAGALASRWAPDWVDGRWWLLTAGLEIVALVCGVLAVVFGVSALGDLARNRSTFKGTVAVAIGFPLACALVVASGVLGGKDWNTLDYPAAWDRLDLGGSEDEPGEIQKSIDEFNDSRVPDAQALRRVAQVGECYSGTPDFPRRRVGCDRMHRIEVVGRVTLGGTTGAYPSVESLEMLARARCEDTIAQEFGQADLRGEVRVIVPDERAWTADDRRSLCLAYTELPTRGPVG